MSLSKNSPAPAFSPLYKQVIGLLTRSLELGEWKPGVALPSEAELAVRFGVSGHDDQIDTLSGGIAMISTPKTTRLQFAVAKSQPEGVSYGISG